jgi:hypothetical protein
MFEREPRKRLKTPLVGFDTHPPSLSPQLEKATVYLLHRDQKELEGEARHLISRRGGGLDNSVGFLLNFLLRKKSTFHG